MSNPPKVYCEIGLNHFGSDKYLNDYLKVLKNPLINGLTIQILKRSFYKNNTKFEKFYLNDKKITSFLKKSKKYKKEIGFATNDFLLAKKFKKKISFLKILSRDFSNTTLINNFLSLNLPLFLSVGLSSSKEIKQSLSKLKKKKVNSI